MLLAAACAFAVGCGRLGFEIVADAAPDLDAGTDAGHDVGVDASCSSTAIDPCNQIPRLAAAPTIDGVIEPCLTTFPITPEGWTGSAAMPTIHARAAVAWRPDGLYVYVVVEDGNLFPPTAADLIYCGDGVEIYVDDDGAFASAGAYDLPGTRQLDVAAPSSATGSSTRGELYVSMGSQGSWDASRFRVVGRPGGYAVETLIQASDLGVAAWTLAAGEHIGLDFSINVSAVDGSPGVGANNCGTRTGQFFERVVPVMGTLCGQPFCDTRAFCQPTLQ